MAAQFYTVDYEAMACCRSCGSSALEEVIAFGSTPLADRLVDSDDLGQPEPICPLTVDFCNNCSLLQIRETVSPEILFGSDYPYFSSVSPALLRHFEGNVKETRARRAVDSDSLVIEVASNDGYLLRNYLSAGVPVLGIDPTDGPVREARALGIETIHDFFSRELAEELRAEGRLADIVHANNVLAHVADTNGFVGGLATILKDDGLLVVECPYVVDLVDHCEFDTIYHQHLCYFSLHALKQLFGQHGLYVQDVQRVSIHGGSLRLFVGKKDAPNAAVVDLLAEEERAGVNTLSFYSEFSHRIERCRQLLVAELTRLKDAGKTIVGYGAPAKACTLMAYMDIGSNYLDFLVDKSKFKLGRHYPGNHLEIRAADGLSESDADYALLFAWNFADEILKEQQAFRERGGKFILPVPELEIR